MRMALKANHLTENFVGKSPRGVEKSLKAIEGMVGSKEHLSSFESGS